MKTDNLIGMKFGRLIVVSLVRKDSKLGNLWSCLCICGNQCVKSTGKLRDKYNKNVSCGCSRKDSVLKAHAAAIKKTTKFSHPLKLKIKWMYRNMVNRCYDPKNHRYTDYGGRGIAVCREWLNNRYKFYEWCLENGIQKHLQIDRRDNDGNYSPDNCKFSTRIEQASNTRKSVLLTWRTQTMTVSQWARTLKVKPQALQHRIDRGWSVERVFTQPYRPLRRRI